MKSAIKRFWGLGLALGVSLSANAAITGTVTTIGGYLAGMRDGDNFVSQFRNPRGLAVDANGILYVADFGNNRIRTVNPATEVTSTFATGGLSGPTALAFDAQGRLYVVNAGGYVVRYNGSGAN